MSKRLFLLIALSLILLAACGGEEESSLPTFTPAFTAAPTQVPAPATRIPQPATIVANPAAQQSVTVTPPPASAFVRVVQGNAALDVVDIYIANQVVAARFRPSNYSNRPVEVPSGEVTLRVVIAGSINSPSNSLFEQGITLQPAEHVVLFLYGDAASIQLQTFSQDLSPLSADSARIGLINVVELSPALTVIANGAGIAENLNYSESQAGITLPAGAYEFAFQAGSGVIQEVTQELISQQVYTIMLTGDASKGQFEAIVFNESATPQSFVRIVHASSDTPPVRVYINNQGIVQNLNFRDFSPDYFAQQAGRFEVRVEAMDAVVGDAPLLRTTLNFTANTHFELLLFDRFVDLRAVLFPVDTAPTGTNTARLILINALPDRSLVRATVPGRIADTSGFTQGGDETQQVDITFGAATRPMLVQTGAQIMDFVTVNSGVSQALFTTPEFSMEQGTAYTYIVMGRQGSDSLLLDFPVGLQTETETAVDVLGQTIAEVRFINGIRTIETVDVEMNGETVADNLGFSELSDKVSVQPGTELDVIIHNADGSSELLQQSFYAREGNRMTLYLLGTGDDIQIFSATDPEEGILQGLARARFVDAMYTVDAIALTYVPGSNAPSDALQDPAAAPPQDNLDIGTTFQYGDSANVDLMPGFYELTVYDISNGVALHKVPFEIKPNTRYDFLVLDTTEDFVLVPLERAND